MAAGVVCHGRGFCVGVEVWWEAEGRHKACPYQRQHGRGAGRMDASARRSYLAPCLGAHECVLDGRSRTALKRVTTCNTPTGRGKPR